MSRKAGTVSEDTQKNLINAAISEFTEYGFQKSSLRRICAKAGVTTGALYFFFKDKEDLFANVIAPVTDGILTLMKEHYETELASPAQELITDENEDVRAGEEFLEFYYQNKVLCRILLDNQDHPVVQVFFNQLAEMMDRQTILLLKVLAPGAITNHTFNECTVHWFSYLLIDSVIHILSHDFDEDRAKEQLKIVTRFLRGGMLSLVAGVTI